MLLSEIIDRFGFNPENIPGIGGWGIVSKKEQIQTSTSAELGDLYIMTDHLFTGMDIGEMIKLGEFIDWDISSTNPNLRYYFYRPKHNKKTMSSIQEIIDEYGFNPGSLDNDVVTWGIVKSIEQEEKDAGAEIGDLYIKTDWYVCREGILEMTKFGRYIGVSQGTVNPSARFYYYRSRTNAIKLAQVRKTKHPIQPLRFDEHGTLRFKPNAIVQHLLDKGPFTLDDLNFDFTTDDRIQFAQLIGYSLSGYGDLSYVDDQTYYAASNMHNKGMTEEMARITYLEELIEDAQSKTEELVETLFKIDQFELKPK